MEGSFKSTLAALSDSPAVAKASGIGEERTLIIDMIERMIIDLDAQGEHGPREGAELVLHNIRAGIHRKDFGV